MIGARNNMTRVLVDMSCTLLHHGHVRLLKKASELGSVVVALTTDQEILAHKGYVPELNYEAREEIVKAIRYVDEIIPSNWMITDDFIEANNINILVHGDDNMNDIQSCAVKIFPRTAGISSSQLRSLTFKTKSQI